MNFDFLKEQNNYYGLFSNACIEAEKSFAVSAEICAVGCRKALELAVKWVYAADSTIKMPYKENLSSLLHENSFRTCLDYRVWQPLVAINKLGNICVHTDKRINKEDAVLALRALFNFIDWIDYCYGPDYVERHFDEKKLPSSVDSAQNNDVESGRGVRQENTQESQETQANEQGVRQKTQEAQTNELKKQLETQSSLISEQGQTIEALKEQLAQIAGDLTAMRIKNQQERTFEPEKISEFKTRKRYIDWDLALAGWTIGDDVLEERKVYGMPGEPIANNTNTPSSANTADGTSSASSTSSANSTSSTNSTNVGFVDYLLLGKDGRPLAIIEAKRTTRAAQEGLQQARLYAECLYKEYGYRPLIFLSNGFDTFFTDDQSAPMRKVSGIFSKDDLQRIMNRRNNKTALASVQIDEKIAGGGQNRYYQIEAIKHACANFDNKNRRGLLVMPCGTGKTRVSAGLVDVAMRAGQVKNVLFLADRLALVSQAAHAYQNYLPQSSRCNLCKHKQDYDARIVFSTYPTILNAIDNVKNDSGVRLYTPAHFDLIIVDEAHRSIFKKYKAIFDYFDALILGLTATPADEVDRNTYEFFEVERGVPTYVYEYETATNKDHVLVPYLGIQTNTDFLEKGITYDELSDEQKEIIEEDFEEQGVDLPDFIANTQINTWVFNEATVDNVLQTLMEEGIRVNGGQDLGKTIIFAQNQKHARFIVERFGKLYPNLPGDYIKTVLHSDDYAHSIIDEFEAKARPVIVVSVDMMDTGIDVPEIVNLVFFKKVRSKIKFLQMLGRGTRLCKGLELDDPLDGHKVDKERFFVFDWCQNFKFFNEDPKIVEGKMGVSLSEQIFSRQASLIKAFQASTFASDDYQNLRGELVSTVHYQVCNLNQDLVSVRLHRQAVEKFNQKCSYEFISDIDLSSLKTEIAPLVHSEEEDIDALRFDAFMYGFMCSLCDGYKITSCTKRLVSISVSLQEKTTIPQVKEKLPILQEICEEHFFDEISILKLEQLRQDLRGIIRFLVGAGCIPDVFTHLDDPVTDVQYGVSINSTDDFADYKLKVQRYMKDYGDSPVIRKLHLNMPMTEFEFTELERIFTQELGNKDDYERVYGNTPFGLLVRQIVKLDHDAAMEAFANFINTENLNEQQISFIHKVVDYVVENGYMEISALALPPFDMPQSFVRMFNTKQQHGLVDIINQIRTNAEKPVA